MNKYSTDPLSRQEYEKYQKIWMDIPEYRRYSPAFARLSQVFRFWKPEVGDVVADLGAGTGVAALELCKRGFPICMYDITQDCLNSEVVQQIGKREDFTFQEACLWEIGALNSDWAWCFDVMEHIPLERVSQVLSAAATSRKGAVFGISCRPDSFGKRIGESLHLTVRSPKWWKQTLSEYWDPQNILVDGDWIMFVGLSR